MDLVELEEWILRSIIENNRKDLEVVAINNRS